jgi:hypothetical protein
MVPRPLRGLPVTPSNSNTPAPSHACEQSVRSASPEALIPDNDSLPL